MPSRWPMIVTMALIGLALAISIAGIAARNGASTASQSALGSSPSPLASGSGCPLPPERPAYLPPGFRPDPIVLSTAPGTGPGAEAPGEGRQRALVWEGTNGEYVTLWSEDTDELLDSPAWERVAIRGRTGIAVWIGAPPVGPVHVIWRERAGRCGIYRLGSRLQSAAGPSPAPRSLQREAARIAESLG